MSSLAPLPLSPGFLERYRLRSRRHHRASLVGGHLMRRKGQSLEFRELGPYTFGDDIRRVDWRASARYGTSQDLLVRKFMAEELLTLVISVDTRDTMRLPKAMPKVLIAVWLAEAIALIALRSNDRVILHRLFGRSSGSILELRSSHSFTGIGSALSRFGAYAGPTDMADLKAIDPYLPPTAVWLILTDFYFDLDDQANMLARKIAAAQDGLRWVILVDLDSWPHEKVILGEGARRIEGPGLVSPERQLNITSEHIRQVEMNIEKHKERFQKFICRAGYDNILWQWPAVEQPEPDQFFRSAFIADKVLQRLFMREA